MQSLRQLSVLEENLWGGVTIFKFLQFFSLYRSTDYHAPPHPPPPLHQKKNAWSQVRLTIHIVYFNKRSNASAMKESETGQNYFTDTQEFMISKLLAYQGNQLNFQTKRALLS